ncbi:hypothetical protein ACHAXA_007828 [Cyclostephanos tholiformis]|uniref:Uncharacterized protein n=1 Tax=Cyclostephanos tholiformis TaxID=382380 RepID=A0ABD3SBY6_9STRA
MRLPPSPLAEAIAAADSAIAAAEAALAVGGGAEDDDDGASPPIKDAMETIATADAVLRGAIAATATATGGEGGGGVARASSGGDPTSPPPPSSSSSSSPPFAKSDSRQSPEKPTGGKGGGGDCRRNGGTSEEAASSTTPPSVKRWTPPPGYQIGAVLADIEMKERTKIASMPPVRRWIPPDKRRENAAAAAAAAAAATVVPAPAPPSVVGRRWTPPGKVGVEKNAIVVDTIVVPPPPSVKRWMPPDRRQNDAAVVVAAGGEGRAVPPATTAVVAPPHPPPPPPTPSVKRWTPPDKARASSSTTNLRSELEDVLRRRSTSNGGMAAIPAATSAAAYTGKRWSNDRPDKMMVDAIKAAEEMKEGIPTAVVYTGRPRSSLSKDGTTGAVVFGSHSLTENHNEKMGSHFSSPIKIKSSSPPSTTPPTSPESDADSGSGSDPSPRKLTYRDEDDDSNPPVSTLPPHAETRGVAMGKSSLRFSFNPIRKWLADNVRTSHDVSVSVIKTNDVDTAREMVPGQAIVSGNIGVLAPMIDATNGHVEDGGMESSSVKEKTDEGFGVKASLKRDDANEEADGGMLVLPSMKDAKEGVHTNGVDAPAGVDRKREDALFSYLQKNLSWQRMRKEKQMRVAGSGIFRSGTSRYYGVQPRDNEHTFAAVLSQKETEKKIEEEREEEKRRQQVASRTLLGFHASVIKLVRELMPSQIDHVDELIKEYEGREAELLEILESMRGERRQQAATGTLVGFHASITRLVRELMPTEIDHVDELIKEYEGREPELLEILESMREKVDQGNDNIDQENDRSICSGTTLRVSNGDSNARDDQGYADEECGVIINGDGIMRTTDVDGQGRKWLWLKRKRARIAFIIGLLLFISGTITLYFVLEESHNSQSNEDDASFIPREDGAIAIANEDILFGPVVACNTFLEDENIQKLGIKNLQAHYPQIAIDGNQAIVASGSGYVAFFSLDQDTKTWSRAEVFGLMVNVGDVKSVAISGNTAVVGAPKASLINLNADGGLVQTGAIFIYERDPTSSTWHQRKGSYIPIEYRQASPIIMMDQYANSHFGASVDIDGDVIVVGAPDESNSRGSFTIFAKDEKSMDWVQIERVRPDDLCAGEFYGHSVQVILPLVAVSADCDINVVLYQIDRLEGESGEEVIQVNRFQEIENVDVENGAISSISMSGNQLAYSTLSGGLFFYKREGQEFVLSQQLSFETVVNPDPLYEYPLRIDAITNMMTLSVANEVYVYTRDLTSSQEWVRESFVLESEGYYAGYKAASVSLSGGHILVAQTEEIYAYDFTGCVRESSVPSFDPVTAAMLEEFSSFSPISSPTTSNPTPSPTPDCNEIDVVISLDAHPSYITWEIVGLSQGLTSTIAISPPYPDSLEFTTDTRSFCLTDGIYQFTIYDNYNDGTSTEWFDVFYQIELNGEVIVSGGSFGQGETKEFNLLGSEEIIRG